jgi:hypothetical protein
MGDALSDLDAARVIAELKIYAPEVVGKIELNLGIEMS